MAIELMPAGSGSKKPVTKQNKIKTAIASTMILALVGVSSFFIYKGATEYMAMHNMQLTWKEILHIADDVPEDDKITEFIDEQGEVIEVTAENDWDPLYRSINLKGLMEINPDVSGYVYIPDTKIDYPILKESEPQVYYYQHYNIYKQKDIYGSIFELSDADRGVPEHDNPITWLFGHHMASGDMFTGIYAFEDQKFVETPVYVYRPDSRSEYHVAYACIVDKFDRAYDFMGYGRGTVFYDELISYLAENSEIEPSSYGGITVDDDMLILSTCKGRAGTSNRLIVVCKKTKTVTVPDELNEKDEPIPAKTKEVTEEAAASENDAVVEETAENAENNGMITEGNDGIEVTEHVEVNTQNTIGYDPNKGSRTKQTEENATDNTTTVTEGGNE